MPPSRPSLPRRSAKREDGRTRANAGQKGIDLPCHTPFLDWRCRRSASRSAEREGGRDDRGGEQEMSGFEGTLALKLDFGDLPTRVTSTGSRGRAGLRLAAGTEQL